MRVAAVSGDGLPVSGLLTSFRSAIILGADSGLIDLPVEIEYGYAWRPDKPEFFPDGPAESTDSVRLVRPPTAVSKFLEHAVTGEHWTHLRRVAARTAQADSSTSALAAVIKAAYEAYFTEWWVETGIDVVVAINMTLSDATPVTAAMYSAADRVFKNRTNGGLVVWDHDLFGSCAVLDDDGSRYYPPTPPTEVTLPPGAGHVYWRAVSADLVAEALTYGAGAAPSLLPNVLPNVQFEITHVHETFLTQHRIPEGTPIHLNPVRVFRVKGVELAFQAFSRVVATSPSNSTKPMLLVFGSLGEDPMYATEVLQRVAALGLGEQIRFLDGVPVSTYCNAAGVWRLDETDLLTLANATGGGVIFTPSTPDVETIGLGPALAAVAKVPSLIAPYNAFEPSYGADLSVAILPAALDDWQDAIDHYTVSCAAVLDGDPEAREQMTKNADIVAERFPVGPWYDLLTELAGAPAVTSEKADAR